MLCYLCESQEEPFHKLERSRLKLFRKVYWTFQEKSSVLCEMCYKKFDYVCGIRAKKRKSKTTLSQSTAGSLSSITEDSGSGNNTSKSNSHSDTLSSSESMSQITSKSNSHSHNISSSESMSPLVPISNLSQSMSSSQSTDSNSTRRAIRGVRVVLSRQGAEVAERSALKRKRTLEVKLPNEPPQTPLERPGNLQAVDEEKESADDEEIQWHVSSDDLASTRPIVISSSESMSPLVPISNLSQSMSSSQSTDSNSTRRAIRGVRVVLSRQGAEVAERSALKRKRTLEVKLPNEPPQTPLERPGNLQAVDEEKESADDEEIQWHVSSDDLALTRPIVKRRKEKVLYLDQRVMDVFLANTSGG